MVKNNTDVYKGKQCRISEAVWSAFTLFAPTCLSKILVSVGIFQNMLYGVWKVESFREMSFSEFLFTAAGLIHCVAVKNRFKNESPFQGPYFQTVMAKKKDFEWETVLGNLSYWWQ